MQENEVTQIKIGRHSVGIVGLKVLIAELAQEYAHKPDEEVQRVMVDRLSRSNYIPGTAQNDYGEAFLREFRKSLGQSYTEPVSEGTDIKVLGPGCSQCDQMERTLMEILTEINLQAGVDHVRDMKEIARYGVMGVPALLINGKVMSVGSIPPRDKIKRWLLEAKASRGSR